MSTALHGIELRPWQQEALSRWQAADRRAVVEAVTGTGKTTLGLAAAADAVSRGLRVLVIVPSTDLLDQWFRAVSRAMPQVRVGRRGAGHRDQLRHNQVLISTIHSAVRESFQIPRGHNLLIADEVHRYGATGFAKILTNDFVERIGLTATFERTDDGVETYLKPYFRNLIPGCDYRRGYAEGILAPVRVMLVGVTFLPDELAAYEEYDERAKTERYKLISEYGCAQEPFGRFMQDVQLLGESGQSAATWSARSYLYAFSKRRAILAETDGKLAMLGRLGDVLGRAGRTIVFAETKAASYAAADVLIGAGVDAQAYSSDLKRAERVALLDQFKAGQVSTLIAPKVLDEGVDVPEADVGIIVAASRSRRQMIQRMGRIIRPKSDGKPATFVVMYMKGSAEDPEEGAHAVFLDQLTEIADEIVTCDDAEAAGRLAEWLGVPAPASDGLPVRPVPAVRDAVDEPAQTSDAARALHAVTGSAEPADLDRVLACVAVLAPIQAQILVARFGLGGGRPVSIEQAAEGLGIEVLDAVWHEDQALARLDGEDTAALLAQLVTGDEQ